MPPHFGNVEPHNSGSVRNVYCVMEWNPLVLAWRVTLASIITSCCFLKFVNFSCLKVKLQKIWCTGRLQTRHTKGRGDTIAPLAVMDKIVTNKNEWRRKAEREYKLSFLGLRVLKRLAYLFSTASFVIPPSPSLTVQDTRQGPFFDYFFIGLRHHAHIRPQLACL